jgi:hypothetical protein
MMRGVRGLIAGIVIVAILCAWFRSLIAYELITQLPVGNRRVVSIYAEPAFHYEPPGFIFCEIVQGDQPILARRRFMSIGPERVPTARFSAVTTVDGELMAITIGPNVVFLYDFHSQQAWPGPYTETNEVNYTFAKQALSRLETHHSGLRCQAVLEYELSRNQRGKSSPQP